MRLKQLRKDAHLTQAQLAKELNVAQNTLSNWENGNRAPDADTLVRIAEYFNVSVDYLLEKDNSLGNTPTISDSYPSIGAAINAMSDAERAKYASINNHVSLQERLSSGFVTFRDFAEIIYNHLLVLALDRKLLTIDQFYSFGEVFFTVKGKQFRTIDIFKGTKESVLYALKIAQEKGDNEFLAQCAIDIVQKMREFEIISSSETSPENVKEEKPE